MEMNGELICSRKLKEAPGRQGVGMESKWKGAVIEKGVLPQHN